MLNSLHTQYYSNHYICAQINILNHNRFNCYSIYKQLLSAQIVQICESAQHSP